MQRKEVRKDCLRVKKDKPIGCLVMDLRKIDTNTLKGIIIWSIT